jgi:hypothetical protein
MTTTMSIEYGPPPPGQLVYVESDHGLATVPGPETCGSSEVIGGLRLLLDEEGQRVVGVAGNLPRHGRQAAILRPPPARPGRLRWTGAPGALATGEDWPVHEDERTGWIRVGRGSPWEDGKGVWFAPGAIAVIDDGRLKALWLRPERALSQTA